MSGFFSRKLLGAIALTFSFLNQASGQDTGPNEFDVLDYVDPLIGTSNGGMYLHEGSSECTGLTR